MPRKPVNLPASIAAQLRAIAASRKSNLDLILRRYAIERLLYRLSVSPFRERFILKGAMLFAAWGTEPFRPTQDLDFLGFGDATPSAVGELVRSIAAQPVAADGLVFDTNDLKASAIRGNPAYGGVRVRLLARLGSIQIPIRIDIGFGDVVTPSAVDLAYPSLIGRPAPLLRTYPRETVVAEKFEAIVALGLGNSRIKDFYDIIALAQLYAFDGRDFAAAIAATFARRRTEITDGPPAGLGAEFFGDAQKVRQWDAFTGREPLGVAAGTLPEAIASIAAFVLPPAAAARAGVPLSKV